MESESEAAVDILDSTSPTSGRSFRDEIINDLKERDTPRKDLFDSPRNPMAPFSPTPTLNSQTLHPTISGSSSPTLTTGQQLLSLYRSQNTQLTAFLKKEGNIFARGGRDSPHGDYVGLANQGATCYLNSLVQALFMLPAFRTRVFAFRHNPQLHGKVEHCIPAQLQRLFARLRLSTRPYVSTKALTQSFGWGSAEGFQQHDVQELFCTLMDALERATPSDNSFAKDLFQGQTSDYLKGEGFCRRKDPVAFNNLMVPIQGHDTLESAMRAYFKPDVLDGSNQYELEKGKKVDALKGVEVNSLPSIFIINLGRFVFDYQTMRRVKINDACSFPETVNMDEMLKGYVRNGGDGKAGDGKAGDGNAGDVVKKPNASDGNKENGKTITLVESTKPGTSTEGKEVPVLGEYELIATMVHSGTTHGGHYRAFIRGEVEEEDGSNTFYNFNDSFVSKLSKEEVVTMFGRDPNVDVVGSSEDNGATAAAAAATAATAAQSDPTSKKRVNENEEVAIKAEKIQDRAKHVARSCVSSYMLMYKKKTNQGTTKNDAQSNDIDAIPKELQEAISKDNELVDAMAKVYVARSKIAKLTVCMGANHFGSVEMLKTATLTETVAEAVRTMLQKSAEQDEKDTNSKEEDEMKEGMEYRLRAHEPRSGRPGRTYGGREHKTLEALGLANGTVTLLLESRHRTNDPPFEEYDPNDFYIQMDQWQKESLDVLPYPLFPPIRVEGKQQATVQQLCDAVKIAATKYNNNNGVNTTTAIGDYRLIYLDRRKGVAIHLDPTKETAQELKLHLQIHSGSGIVLERLTVDPNIIEEYERAQNVITLRYNLPAKKTTSASYNLELICDKRDTLLAIKEKIQPTLGIENINHFRLKCNANGSGKCGGGGGGGGDWGGLR
jgi:hypothetical protein